MKRLAIFVLGVMTLSAAGTAQSQEGVSLSNEEATAFIKGKNLTATRVAGGTPSLQFKDDGSMYGSNSVSSDSGKWRIENGKLCMSWQRWEYEGCGNLIRIGDEVRHLYPNGSVHLIFKTSIDYLKQEPARGTLPFGEIVYVDDGACPAGEVKEITGGNRSQNILRKVRCVKREKQ